ncbi:MAG: LysM peptidoglycan-binding domain-containing protein [Firmicutes bacterium]|nr:LysM peptidoglycan-binding domain-containing protein [Bacillota bacterium]
MRQAKISLLFGLWFSLAVLATLIGFLFIERDGWETLAMKEILVKQGDTLWSIAARTAPETDPRVTIDRIVQVNGLTTLNLRPGQRLFVPRMAPRGFELARNVKVVKER